MRRGGDGLSTAAKGLWAALLQLSTYLERNALWHTEESLWKAEEVMWMLNRQTITPRTICEVGCGAGEVLKQLQQRRNNDCDLLGCDVSPRRSNFAAAGLMKSFISFLPNIKERALYKILNPARHPSANGSMGYPVD